VRSDAQVHVFLNVVGSVAIGYLGSAFDKCVLSAIITV
jgi:hypothetical protein